MILQLFCPKCAYFAAKEQHLKGYSQISIDVPTPMSAPVDDGKYEVRCAAGHISTVTVDNIKFELLFEMGLNALVDGYPREAVSSFASSLERFYEFYWHVVAVFHSIPREQAAATWKTAAKQSERQLGMFLTAALLLTRKCPPLPNPKQEVKLRNEVIHGGYIPTVEEATAFGDTALRLINDSLESLRTLAPTALISTYEQMSPASELKSKPRPTEITWNDDEEHTGTVNILTFVNVLHPPKAEEDVRRGSVADQFKRIMRDRQPHRMTLLANKIGSK